MAEEKAWLIVEDGRPGHYNQSLGLLQIAGAEPSSAARLSLPKPRKLLKRPLQWLVWMAKGWPTILGLIYWAYYGKPLPSRPKADILASTGGDTLLANMIFSKVWGLPNIFIGRRSTLTDNLVQLLVTTVGDPIPKRVVVAPFAPVFATHSSHTTLVSAIPSIAVLIGGNSKEYTYSSEDYIALARALNQLCHEQRVKLLITTSRRTGLEAEDVLRRHIQPEHIADATWFGTSPRPTAALYSSSALAIFCSEDSGSMLTESLRYNVPLIMFYPKHTQKSRFYKNFLQKIKKQNVKQKSIPDIVKLDIHSISPAMNIDYNELESEIKNISQKKHKPEIT